MEKIVLTLCILLSVITMNAQNSITGIWNVGKDNTKVEITEDNDTFIGKIVSSDNSKAKIGTPLLKDIKLVDGEWKGKMFSPKKKKWFDAVLEEKTNQLLITVSAGFMSKTIAWAKE